MKKMILGDFNGCCWMGGRPSSRRTRKKVLKQLKEWQKKWLKIATSREENSDP